MTLADSHCPLCQSERLKLCTTAGNVFRVWRCQVCSFTWVDRTDLARSEAKPNYEDYPYNHNIMTAFEMMKPVYVKGMEQRIKRTMHPRILKDASFLDVGCANGEYLWTAKQVGFGSVAGVEIDRAAMQRARVYGEVVDDLSNLSHTAYDVIQIKNVISNILNFTTWLTKYLELLKPEGVLWLDVLNQDSLTAVLRNTFYRNHHKTGRYWPLRPPYVVNGFTKASLSMLLRNLGLDVIYMSTTYLGSPMLPYNNTNKVATGIGFIGTLIGKGSMIIAEARGALGNRTK